MTDYTNNLTKANEAFNNALALEDSGEQKKALKIREALAAEFPFSKRLSITLAKSYKDLDRLEEAEEFYRKSVELAPDWELASLQLFYLLWDSDKKNEAMNELSRFQKIGNSDEYLAIVKRINKIHDTSE